MKHKNAEKSNVEIVFMEIQEIFFHFFFNKMYAGTIEIRGFV